MVVAGSKGSKINISQVCLQKFYPNYYLVQRFKQISLKWKYMYMCQ